MAIDINVRITLATGEAYSAYENNILAAVAGAPVQAPAAPAAEAAPAPADEAAPAPAAPKRTRRTKAQIEAEEKAAAEAAATAAEDEEAAVADDTDADADEDAADLLGTDEPVQAPTTQDAVDAATVVLTAGGTAKVKAALAKAGVKRVSELKGAGIAAFIADLQD